jgi:hypothetical protein
MPNCPACSVEKIRSSMQKHGGFDYEALCQPTPKLVEEGGAWKCPSCKEVFSERVRWLFTLSGQEYLLAEMSGRLLEVETFGEEWMTVRRMQFTALMARYDGLDKEHQAELEIDVEEAKEVFEAEMRACEARLEEKLFN